MRSRVYWSLRLILDLRNPDSAEATAARQEAIVLEGINVIMSGGEINAADSNNNPVLTEERNGLRGSEERGVNDNDRNQDRSGLRGSPVASLLTIDDDTNSKLRKSPATMMAEASVLSQQAALKEADNLKCMIEVQKEELNLRKHDSELQQEEQKAELSLMKAERESSTKLLSKLVDKLCPDVDPTDLYTSRKRKLDEARAALGEELYNLRLTQLRDEFLKSSAL